MTTAFYPDDLDTTSLAFRIMDCDKEVVSSVMDEMLEYVNDEGIIMVCSNISAPLVVNKIQLNQDIADVF